MASPYAISLHPFSKRKMDWWVQSINYTGDIENYIMDRVATYRTVQSMTCGVIIEFHWNNSLYATSVLKSVTYVTI